MTVADLENNRGRSISRRVRLACAAITRRDFLNGAAVGAGGLLASPWLQGLLAARASTPSAQDRPGYYPPTLTSLQLT